VRRPIYEGTRAQSLKEVRRENHRKEERKKKLEKTVYKAGEEITRKTHARKITKVAGNKPKVNQKEE